MRTGSTTTRSAAWWFLPAATVLVGLVYVPTLRFPYVWDDEIVMRERWIRSPADLVHLVNPTEYFRNNVKRSYRPVATLWEAGLQWLGVQDPALARGAVLGLHSINAALLAQLGLSLGLAPSAAALAGGIMAIHPVNAEAVLGMVASADVLATAGVLLTLLAWRQRRTLTACAALALGVLTKETALLATVLLILHDRLIEGREWRDVLAARRRDYVCIGVTAACFLILRFVIFTGPSDSGAGYIGGGLIANLATMSQAVAHGLRLLVAPLKLTVFHEVAVVQSVWVPGVLLALFIIALWGLVAWKVRRVPLLLFGWLWAVVALLPVLNVVPFLRMAGLAERYLYLSSCGIAIACAAGWARSRHYLLRVVFVIALPALALQARGHTALWSTPLRFYEALVEACPNMSPAHVGLCKVLLDHEQLDEARLAAERARILEPANPTAAAYLGMIEMKRGAPAQALGFLQEAVHLAPRDFSHHYRLGLALEASGRFLDAAEAYGRASALQPRDAQSAIQKGVALLRGGKPADAAAWMEQVVGQHENISAALDVFGVALVAVGRIREGIAAYERALSLGRRDPGLLTSLGEAWLRLGDTGRATSALKEALRLDPDYAPARKFLARVQG